MRLHLVRHGRTPSNVEQVLDTTFPGAGLDAVGVAQAEALVRRFDGVPLEGLFVSDLPRTQQTISPLAAARGLEPTVLPGLREIQAGDEELSRDYGPYISVLRNWAVGDGRAAMPNGDSRASFFSRYDEAVATIGAAGHEHALLVSHGAALRMWVGATASGLDPEQAAHQVMGNTAVIVLEGEPGDWHFVSWDSGYDVAGSDGDPID